MLSNTGREASVAMVLQSGAGSCAKASRMRWPQ